MVGAHRLLSWAEPGGGSATARREDPGPRILALELLTAAPLAAMKTFYAGTLGLRVLEEKDDRLTIGAGQTRLAFVPAGSDGTSGPDAASPFYHVAFNIPENKILAARAWQLERSPLMPIPERLRDPAYPDDVVDFRHWNAHSVFFIDPGGNVVEYIARHDLRNAAPGPFGTADILYASEIAFVVDDVAATALSLRGLIGVEQYRGADERFTAIGDERGLLLIVKRGRTLNFHPDDPSKAARVFRTAATVKTTAATAATAAAARGTGLAAHAVPGFPYEISLEG
jgi:catechol 2,3-dioxygenase-like lactoylglutathione lyase family enzyme